MSFISTPTAPTEFLPLRAGWRDSSIWPGLVLATVIAGAAFAARSLPGLHVLSPLILAITIGVIFQNLVGMPERARRGVAFAMRVLLRWAIVLLGFQLTWQEMAGLGLNGITVIAASLAASFAFTTALGRILGVERGLTQLIAAGTSVCGASAIVATNTVTQAGDEDVVYAIACISIFGSVAMFVFPWLPDLLQLDAAAYGLWTGAAIHEVAQVVAAGFAVNDAAGTQAVVAKLARVMMLAPLVFLLAGLAVWRRPAPAQADKRAKVPMPWFVLGFVAVSGVNSLVDMPAVATQTLGTTTSFLLAVSLAAIGLQTDADKLLAKGPRPFLLAAIAGLFIAVFAFMLVRITT